MEQRLQEYVEYYRVRAAKYEESPLYRQSARSERALLEAFESSGTLEEARAKVEEGDLATENARALIVDQERARAALYDSLEEPVRAAISGAVLEAVAGIDDPVELANAAGRARTATQNAVLVDELVRAFETDVTVLEDLDVLEHADVPPEWRPELEREAARLAAQTADVWRDVRLPAARQWDPSWHFDYGVLLAPRHRRRLPVADAYLAELVDEHRARGWV